MSDKLVPSQDYVLPLNMAARVISHLADHWPDIIASGMPLRKEIPPHAKRIGDLCAAPLEGLKDNPELQKIIRAASFTAELLDKIVEIDEKIDMKKQEATRKVTDAQHLGVVPRQLLKDSAELALAKEIAANFKNAVNDSFTFAGCEPVFTDQGLDRRAGRG